MAFPIKTCKVCGEEFELRPDHPGYANRCRECNAPQEQGGGTAGKAAFEDAKDANAARRAAIKDMLYTNK